MRNKLLLLILITLTYTIQAQAQGKMLQRGLAEMVANGETGTQYLAVHRTFKIGNKILVKNSANGKTVVVKIVGKLPDIGANSKVVIKLSTSAYNALNAKGKRFAVELYDAPKEPAPEDEKKAESDNKEVDDEVKAIHEVKNGDTLYGIAIKYEVTVEQIMEWNELKKYTLQKGQKLKILKK
jgi:LysM repeat protein